MAIAVAKTKRNKYIEDRHFAFLCLSVLSVQKIKIDLSEQTLSLRNSIATCQKVNFHFQQIKKAPKI